MLNIFRAKRQFQDLEWMHVDMHSHLLPGIDDGASSLDDSLHLLEQLQDLGLRKFFFTPHVFREMYPNTPDTIQEAFQQIASSASADAVGGFAAEYMVDNYFDRLLQTQKPLAHLPDHHVLIEMSYMQESAMIEKTIFDLQMQGYKPILAHPERYVFYHSNMDRIEHLRNLGCLLQLNLLSLYGYYGSKEKQVARLLCEKGLIDLVGSDVHHRRHIKAIEHGLAKEDLWPYFKRCRLKNQELFSETYA